jgi:hypothetical protein
MSRLDDRSELKINIFVALCKINFFLSKMTNISINNIRKNVTTSLDINDYELDFNLVKHAVHGCMTNSQRIT